MTGFFAGILVVYPRARTHAQRQRFMLVFVASVTLLFAWFGVVSWLGMGDLSMLAIAEVLISAVFFLPGYLRRWSYALQALGTGLMLAWLDRSGKFLGQMQFANLMVIATVSVVMDRYIWRNAHLLFTEKCRVARERRRSDEVLHNALPPRITDELKTYHRVQARNHPAMSILFADIVGFTGFAAQRSPEQVLKTLNALFSEIDALVDLHQVEKIKTIGDAYMAVSQTRPQALAGLALSMLDAMQRFNADHALSLALRIGLHSGPTIAGVIGRKRFLYDVWGDAVNPASRMESAGEPGRIHASEALFLALQQGFEF
jgi:class 3 adenylate cyclase